MAANQHDNRFGSQFSRRQCSCSGPTSLINIVGRLDFHVVFICRAYTRSTIVLLGSAMLTCGQYKQPLYLASYLVAICDSTFDRGLLAPVWGRGGRRGLEKIPEYNPVATSYRLSIVTIGLSLTVFAVPRVVTDGQTELVYSKRRHAQCTKVHPPPRTLLLT